MGKNKKVIDDKIGSQEQIVMPHSFGSPAKGPIYMQPIVQPIALTPYNQDNQDLAQYNGDYDYDDEYDDDYEEDYRRLNGLKLTTFIFGLIAVAVIVLGKFLNMDAIKPYLLLSGTKSGFEIIMGITTVMSSSAGLMEKLPTILLTAGSGLLVILMLVSIFSVKRGTGGFSKFLAILMVLCMIGFVVLTVVNKVSAYGGYIVGGLSLFIAIFTLVGKKRR